MAMFTSGERMNKENKLVVANVGWANAIPEWLLEEIKAERMILGLAGIMKPLEPHQQVGDAEVLVYLMTESLTQPLSNEHYTIYLYLFNKIMKRNGKEIPEGLKFDRELDSYHKHILNDLKYMIWKHRGGEIKHPLLNAMRELKKDIEKKQKIIEEKKVKPLTCFGGD